MIYKLSSLVLHLLLFSGIATAQQKPFTLSGTIQGKTGSYIYLNYPEGAAGTKKKDSSLIGNGKFSFKGTLYGPATEATLTMDRKISSSSKIAGLFLVPGNMQLSLDYNNFRESAVLKGSVVQEEADLLEKSKADFNAQKQLINDTYRKAYAMYKEAVKAQKEKTVLHGLQEAADLVKEAMYPLDKHVAEIDLAFMDQNPTSFVTALKLLLHLRRMPFNEAQERYGKLPEEIKNTYVGKFIKGELDRLGRAVGGQAFQFASMELRGEEIKLSDYKGKYVLLDFWASWCGVCRKGHPHLLSLYAKYRDKGLEIIGIAADSRNPEAWKKAIKQDGIAAWKHVNEKLTTPGGELSIADQYGIRTVQTKILVDPTGVIIGRYGEDGEIHEALDRKLAELFGK